MRRLNENLTRKHNWYQLQIIKDKINKEGGDISKKLKDDYKRQSKTNNSYGIDNPLDKKIALSDDEPNANTHTDPQLKNLPKNSIIKKFESFFNEDTEKISDKEFLSTPLDIELFNKAKDNLDLRYEITNSYEEDDELLHSEIEKMDSNEIKSFLNENKKETMKKEDEKPKDRGNADKIHREMKTIRNWDNYFNDLVGGNPNPSKERNVMAGKQVEYEKGKEGYIEDVKGDKVIIQTTDNTGHIVKSFSDIAKMYKVEKPSKDDKVVDDSLQGPKQVDKKEIETSGEIKDLKDKSEETKDSKKLGKEIYKEKEVKIKKLQDYGKTTF
jgi:hypothetical protein